MPVILSGMNSKQQNLRTRVAMTRALREFFTGTTMSK